MPSTDSYNDIGALLRRARQDMSLTIEQASQMLHIRARYLEALENGRLAELPGIAYTKGYLTSYAAFLGLDKEELVRRFEQVELGLPKKGFYFPESFSKEKKPAGELVWGGFAAMVAAYALWALFLKPPLIAVTPLLPDAPVEADSGAFANNQACFTRIETLYPPCYRALEDIFPRSFQLRSIMELQDRWHQFQRF